MKKTILCALLIISSSAVYAQATSLVEDFDISCASASGFPEDWVAYNPIAATNPSGAWQCAPTQGRWSTPGIACTGIWSAVYHLDTSYLISPALNLSTYPGNIYIQFDTKTSYVNLDGRLALLVSKDSLFRTAIDTVMDLSASLIPVFSNSDSSGWVTHEAELTPYKSDVPLYISFQYTSSSTSGGVWYLDNIQTTTFPAHVPGIVKSTLPLTVIGNSTSSQIVLSCTIAAAGAYHLSVYDIAGRKVAEENVNAPLGTSSYTISGLQLHSGMYFVKMDNGIIYGATKTIVQ